MTSKRRAYWAKWLREIRTIYQDWFKMGNESSDDLFYALHCYDEGRRVRRDALRYVTIVKGLRLSRDDDHDTI